jgi:hypothetical protein
VTARESAGFWRVTFSRPWMMSNSIAQPLAVLVLAVVTACADPTSDGPPADLTGRSADRLTPPSTTPDIAGTVTRVMPGDSVFRRGTGGDPNAPVSCPPSCAPTSPPMRSVLVEELPGSASGDNKSVVKVPREARVLRRVGGSVTEVGFDYARCAACPVRHHCDERLI